MLLLRKTPAQHYCKSFGELVDNLLAYIIRQFTHEHTAICVFGVYGEDSNVKAYERRRHSITPRHYEVIAGASLPKWNTVLEVDENNTTFSLFMSN